MRIAFSFGRCSIRPVAAGALPSETPVPPSEIPAPPSETTATPSEILEWFAARNALGSIWYYGFVP